VFGIGSQELLIVFLVVLLLFGAERIPEVARALGKSMRDFKKAAGEIEAEIQEAARQKDALLGTGPKRPGPRARPGSPATGGGSAGEDGAPEASKGHGPSTETPGDRAASPPEPE